MWFAPGGKRYRATEKKAPAHEMPDSLRKVLPKTAKVVESATSEVVVPEAADYRQVDTARVDAQRAAAIVHDAEAAAQAEADAAKEKARQEAEEAERLKRKEEFAAALAAEEAEKAAAAQKEAEETKKPAAGAAKAKPGKK